MLMMSGQVAGLIVANQALRARNATMLAERAVPMPSTSRSRSGVASMTSNTENACYERKGSSNLFARADEVIE
jgi:hypothetical protein